MSLTVADRVRSVLPLGAVAGPVLFTAAWIALGGMSDGYTLFGTRIAPYSSITQPISGLGLGATGPWMNAAFIIGGLVLFAGLMGVIGTVPLRPGLAAPTTVLLLLTPIGMIMCGLFTLEDVLPHFLGFMLASGTPVMSFLLLGIQLRDRTEWRLLSRALLIASPATAVLLGAFFVTFDPLAAAAGQGVSGLVQRVLVVEVLGCFAALGWVAYRQGQSQRRRGRMSA